jgi:hypothetical protein
VQALGIGHWKTNAFIHLLLGPFFNFTAFDRKSPGRALLRIAVQFLFSHHHRFNPIVISHAMPTATTSSAEASITSSAAAAAAPPLSEQEILSTYRKMQSEMQNLVQHLTKVEMERNEHRRVIIFLVLRDRIFDI